VLTLDQKQQRVDDLEQCLAIFNRNKDEFSVETLQWMKHGCFTTLQSPIDSQPSGLNAMNRIQSMERRNGQLAPVFWDARGILFIDYLEKGQTINSEYYIALLERLNDEITKKRPHLKKTKVLFHQDHALCHKSFKTTAKLHELGYKLLPHPPYSPDLAPSDYFLFAGLKRMLAGKKFSTNEEVIAETDAYSYYRTIKMVSKNCYNHCIALERNDIE
jgi:transposase